MRRTRLRVPEKRVIALALTLLLVAAGAQGAERVIGAASSMTLVFPDDPPSADEIEREIALDAARGEAESAQVVIVAGGEPLGIEKVEVSDLQCGDRRIAGDNVEVRLAAHVMIAEGKNTWRGIRRPGLWPDPLLRFRPFTCPAGECRLLWVTVTVPRDAAPGQYSGKIRVQAAGSRDTAVPVSLRVRKFAIPKAPHFRTSYWTHVGDFYDLNVEPEAFLQNIRLFGAYRTSTGLWPEWNFREPKPTMHEWVVLWYLEEDGTFTCDISGMQRTIEAALEAGFSTIELSHGCWMASEFEQMPVIDRQTGQLLSHEDEKRKAALAKVEAALDDGQKAGFPGTYYASLFLPQMCDWLDSKGLLENTFMQLYDEAIDPAKFPRIREIYTQYRRVEPRLKLLGLTGVNPEMQGTYDIWAPFVLYYDPPTYDKVREGISLRGKKNFKAAVTASSCGVELGGSQGHYRPIDGYDGCDYTKWTPSADCRKVEPPPETNEWIRFDFETPQEMDGIRIEPFAFLPWDSQPTNLGWYVEASADGENFELLELTERPGIEKACSFPARAYKAVRLTYAMMDSSMAPGKVQTALALNRDSAMSRPDGTEYVMPAMGVREVEFLREGLPLEATLPRDKVRPAEMWEYQVGAGYPSCSIDADPSEIRATAWQCWARGLLGWLNYGGGQWQRNMPRPKTEDPMVWNWGLGSPWIVYPGQKEVLPSVRLARFRDGIDDYDYLVMLHEKQPDHPVLERLRADARLPYAWTRRWAGGGPDPYGHVGPMLEARAAVADALDRLCGNEDEN